MTYISDWADILHEYMSVLDDAIAALQEAIEPDEIRPARLHDLYDMLEDTTRIRQLRAAESALAWRMEPQR